MANRPAAHLETLSLSGTLAEHLLQPRHSGSGLSLYWLGQAGFVIDAPGLRLVIDPYLSNSLSTKYRETPYPHDRMAPAPIQPDELGSVDYVFCTHHHTDHMDGETLARLAQRLPDLRFVVPRASRDLALERIGCSADRLIEVDAGQTAKMSDHFTLTVMRAAHERLEKTEDGYHKFLGYGLTIAGLKLFHSGDTIPFAGQAAEIAAFAPHVTLFPVNGRSSAMLAAGFAGNMSVQEAIALSENVDASLMIAHHYGMFAFNTVSPDRIDLAAKGASIPVKRAVFGVEFSLTLS